MTITFTKKINWKNLKEHGVEHSLAETPEIGQQQLMRQEKQQEQYLQTA